MSEAKTWYFEIEVEKRKVNPKASGELGGLIDLHLTYSTPVCHRQENHSVFFPCSSLQTFDFPNTPEKLLCAALRQSVMLRFCNNVEKIATIMMFYLHCKFVFTPDFLSGQEDLRPCIRINLDVEFEDRPRGSGEFVAPDDLDVHDKLIILGRDLRRLNERCGGVLMAAEGVAAKDKHAAPEMKRVRTSGLPAEDCGDCPICFERIDKSYVAIQTACCHMFHETCLVMWLCAHHSCPMCRSTCAVMI